MHCQSHTSFESNATKNTWAVRVFRYVKHALHTIAAVHEATICLAASSMLHVFLNGAFQEV